MFSNTPHRVFGASGARRRAAAALSTTLIGTLAALPTASAFASAGSGGSGANGSAVRALVSPGELLPAGELEELLAQLPLSDISAAQLAHYLAGLEGIAGLAGLEGLLGKELGAGGLEAALTEAIEQLKLSDPAATLGELANLEGLLPALEGKLGGLLKTLLGSLLSTEQQELLEGALGTLQLDQLVGSLLGSVAPQEQLATELSGLAGGLFGELGGEGKLEAVLGSSELTGSFTSKDVKEVAEQLGTTPQAVSEELGQTTAELPETATMLTAPLGAGKLVGIAPALKGLALGLLGGGEGAGEGEGGKGSGEGSGTGEGGKGTGEGSGSGAGGSGTGQGGGGPGAGSQGGSGGGSGGQGGSTGGMTILLTLPSAPAAQASAATAKRALGKVRILSHRVRGHRATLVLQVPARGGVTLSGHGVRTARGRATKPERLMLSVPLTKAGVAALHGGRRHVRVKLNASFKPAGGAGSTASVVVSFG